MAEPETSGKSWWSTMPGLLTALAGTITAVGGLVAILSQSGLIGAKSGAKPDAGASTAGKSVEPVGATTPQAVATQSSPGAVLTGASASANGAAAASVARSPAEVLAGLKAHDFKGLAVTHKDGSVVALAPGAEVAGAALPLSNGQSVQFERIVAVEIEQPWDGSVTLTLTNGQKLATRLNDYNLYGKNDLGPYRELLSNLRRIDFIR
ncbi:hypothetical protein [Methylibium sp.]|uniref:hypothetical protein n=1 Tax=Methylibium sp. TaxID=2067992 RepID=UPI003D0E6D96